LLDRDTRPEGGEWSKTKNETPKTPLSRTVKCRPLKGYTLDKTQRKHTPKSPSSKRQRERRKRALRTLAEGVGQSGPLYWGKHRERTQHNGPDSPTGSKMNGSDKSSSAGKNTAPHHSGSDCPIHRVGQRDRADPHTLLQRRHGSDYPTGASATGRTNGTVNPRTRSSAPRSRTVRSLGSDCPTQRTQIARAQPASHKIQAKPNQKNSNPLQTLRALN